MASEPMTPTDEALVAKALDLLHTLIAEDIADPALENMLARMEVEGRARAALKRLSQPPSGGWDEEVRDLIVHAYEQGCVDVHNNYQEDTNPEFYEAACDYAASVSIPRQVGGWDDAAVARTIERLDDYIKSSEHYSGYVNGISRRELIEWRAALNAPAPRGEEGWEKTNALSHVRAYYDRVVSKMNNGINDQLWREGYEACMQDFEMAPARRRS